MPLLTMPLFDVYLLAGGDNISEEDLKKERGKVIARLVWYKLRGDDLIYPESYRAMLAQKASIENVLEMRAIRRRQKSLE